MPVPGLFCSPAEGNFMFKIASKPLATMAVLLILAACGKPAPPAAADPDPDADTTAPAVHVTSGNHSPTADYALSGVSWDDTGTTSVTWSLNGGDNQPAALSDTAFTANVTLAAGPNTIHVTARDAAGNEGSASRTVTFSPIPNTSAVSPEAALPGSAVTFTGTGLGAAWNGSTAGRRHLHRWPCRHGATRQPESARPGA